jgi:hypothetical protein
VAALTCKDLVDRIQAQVVSTLGGSGWRASRAHPAMFGMDARQIAHLAFVVWSPSLVVHEVESGKGRQARTETLVRSTIEVRFAFRVRADAASDDSDSALTSEGSLVAAIMGVSLTNLHIKYVSAARAAAGDGEYSIHALTFEALHQIALQ